MIKSSEEFIVEVLDACDVRASKVRSITIKAEVRGAPVMIIERLISQEETEEIKKLL